MHLRNRCTRLAACSLFVFSSCSLSRVVGAAPKQGEVVQTDSIGMTLVTHDFETDTNTTVADVANLNEYFGIHYYFADRLRLGVTFQWSERIAPAPEEGTSRIQRLAFLPQIGWNFCDPFYITAIYGIAPYTRGQSRLDMTVEGALGVGFPISDRVRWSFSLVAPYAFYAQKTLGLTVVTGIGIRL